MFKQRPTRLANPLERCWQGGALCSTSAAAVLIFRGYLTVALSRSLSLSSVTLATYFLHGNSISCCAHCRKKTRHFERFERVQKRLKFRDLNWGSEESELCCSACLTIKLAVWWSNGGVKHNSHWQPLTITEDVVGDITMWVCTRLCLQDGPRALRGIKYMYLALLWFHVNTVCLRIYLDPTMCDTQAWKILSPWQMQSKQ